MGAFEASCWFFRSANSIISLSEKILPRLMEDSGSTFLITRFTSLAVTFSCKERATPTNPAMRVNRTPRVNPSKSMVTFIDSIPSCLGCPQLRTKHKRLERNSSTLLKGQNLLLLYFNTLSLKQKRLDTVDLTQTFCSKHEIRQRAIRY